MKSIFEKCDLLNVVLPFLLILSVVLVLFLNTIINKPIWQNYRTLMFQTSNTEKLMQTIKDAGIKGAVTIESLKNRFSDREEADPPFTSKELYARWFENEDDGLMYVYVPKKTYIPFSFLKALTDSNIPFHIEGQVHLSVVNFVSCTCLFIMLLFFSNRKVLFFLSSIPLLIISFLVRGELIFSAIFLMFLFTLYIVELLFVPYHLTWKEREERLKSNYFVFILFLFIVILTFLDTYLAYIYFIFSIFSVCSIGYLLEKFVYLSEKEKERERTHAKMMIFPMHPASTEQIYSKKKSFMLIFVLLLSYAPHAVFNIFCLCPLSHMYNNMFSLPLPSKISRSADFSCDSFIASQKSKPGDSLPDLISYIADNWLSTTYPYRSAYEPLTMPKKDECVIFRDFYLEEGGIIKEKEELVFSFDDEFIKAQLEKTYPFSIEEMLKTEGGFVSAVYNLKFFKITRYNDLDTLLSLIFISASLGMILLKTVA